EVIEVIAIADLAAQRAQVLNGVAEGRCWGGGSGFRQGSRPARSDAAEDTQAERSEPDRERDDRPTAPCHQAVLSRSLCCRSAHSRPCSAQTRRTPSVHSGWL